MSANRNKTQNDQDFDTYRQIAPELFSDESLRNLMKSKNNNRDEIVAAIENIWHDTPEKQAVGSEWVTTSKPTVKKATTQPTRRPENAGGRGGGRKTNQLVGGRGSGESIRSEKSSAASSNKISNGKTSPPVVVAEVSTPVNTAVIQESTAPLESGKPAWGSGPSFAAKLKMAEIEKAKAAAAILADEEKKRTTKVEEDAGVVVATSESGEAVSKRSTTPKSRVRKSKPGKKNGDDVGSAAEEIAPADVAAAKVEETSLGDVLKEVLVLESAPALPVAEDIAVSTAAAVVELPPLDAAPGFLKIGKWEASAAGTSDVGGSSEIFQFGSFGTSTSFVPPAAQKQAESIESSAVSSWGAAAEDSLSSVVQDSSAVGGGWVSAAAADSSSSSGILPVAPASSTASSAMGSLFSSQQQQQQQQPKGVMEGAVSAGAPRPPPGLEHNSQVGAHKQNQQNSSLRSAATATGQQQPQQKYNKETAQQQQQQQQLLQMQQQSMLYGQQPLQQYGQQQSQLLPPGISAPAANNRSGLQQQALPASSLPYTPYTPGFDLSQPPFMHAPYNPVTPNTLSSLLPGSTGSVGVAAPVSGASASAPSVPQSGLQSQQQQYAPAAPFPFYGNPYYNQAYYYGQPPQVPNFYGQQQQGGRYQDQGPYGANPYGNPGSLYPPQQQPAGQFGDSAASYGMSQGAAPAGGNQQQGTNKVGGAKAASSVSAVGTQQSVAGLQPQDLGMGGGVNYGYNPYNQQQRGMDPQQAAWQYQQSQAAWAGGPIMNFNTPPSGGLGAGLLPNQQQSFGQQQQQQSPHLGLNLSGGQQQSQQQGSNNMNNSNSQQQRGGPPASAPYGSTGASSSFIGSGNSRNSNNNNNGVGAPAAGGVQGW